MPIKKKHAIEERTLNGLIWFDYVNFMAKRKWPAISEASFNELHDHLAAAYDECVFEK